MISDTKKNMKDSTAIGTEQCDEWLDPFYFDNKPICKWLMAQR